MPHMTVCSAAFQTEKHHRGFSRRGTNRRDPTPSTQHPDRLMADGGTLDPNRSRPQQDQQLGCRINNLLWI